MLSEGKEDYLKAVSLAELGYALKYFGKRSWPQGIDFYEQALKLTDNSKDEKIILYRTIWKFELGDLITQFLSFQNEFRDSNFGCLIVPKTAEEIAIRAC